MLCEIIGAWPTVFTDVFIALLPKSSGGFRPIGIFPTLIRVWFRLRAPVIRAWERAHERPYFFAGCGKGADVALWLQAAHLESVALAKRASAASLVDLVKAFERVSHVALLDAALRWDYPIWILRLSLAAYRLARRISINGILSGALLALRGITAGSVFATTELRLLLLVALDDVAAAFPELPLHVYVDDMFLAVVGAPRHVCRVLTDATVLLVKGLTAALLEVSHTKSEGVASSPGLCRDLEHSMRKLGMKFSTSCKSLGGDVMASLQRRVPVQRMRQAALRRRRSRLGRLRGSIVNTSRLFRTGINAAASWGAHVVGVSTTRLLQWRREVARGCSAAAAGKSADLVLIFADDTDSHTTDPAFAAHVLPIQYWAEAVWEGRRAREQLTRDLMNARVRLARARSPWAAVTGPAAAFLATAARIG